jgi:hypothetical protein
MLAAKESKAKPVKSRRGGKKKAEAPKVVEPKVKVAPAEEAAPEEKTEE